MKALPYLASELAPKLPARVAHRPVVASACREGLGMVMEVRDGSDAAHIRMASPERGKLPTGMQVKPSDRFAVPLNRVCHERQHSGSEARFWSALGRDPFEIADRLYAEYQGAASSSNREG